MNEKTEKLTAKIEKDKNGNGFWLSITNVDNSIESTAWPITEDEIPVIFNVCEHEFVKSSRSVDDTHTHFVYKCKFCKEKRTKRIWG